MRSLLVALTVATVLAVAVAAPQDSYPSGVGSVYLDAATGAFRFQAGKVDTSAVAWGNFTDQTAHPSAFGELSVHTNAAFNSTAQMYAAGYLEGALTVLRTHQHWQNIQAYVNNNFPDKTMPQNIATWLENQDAWVRANVASNSSDLWQQMGDLYAQFEGLIAGHNAAATADLQLTRMDMMVINGIGDLLDLIPVRVASASVW